MHSTGAQTRPERLLAPDVQAFRVKEHGRVNVDDLVLDLTCVDQLAAHMAGMSGAQADPCADSVDARERSSTQGGPDACTNGQRIGGPRDDRVLALPHTHLLTASLETRARSSNAPVSCLPGGDVGR
jgi:hypothetical protein